MEDRRLALIGFGNVGRAFVELLLRKEQELAARYGLRCRVVAIATGSRGHLLAPDGVDLETLLARSQSGSTLEALSPERAPASAEELIDACQADALFEVSPVNYQSGEPALSYLRQALGAGMHAITANKGPVVHGYRELRELARVQNRAFLFEATVMDGAPVFSLWRSSLRGARLKGFRGILNSTTNLILGLLESGSTLEEAISHAQAIGIAETDPSGDLEGWDAAIKVALLVTVLMGEPTLPNEVDRTGIARLTPADIRTALDAGERWKLICRAHREGEHVVSAVSPERISAEDPLYAVSGTTSAVTLQTDVLGDLSVTEQDPGPATTAYGLLADFLTTVR